MPAICSNILRNIGANKFNDDAILGRDTLVYTIIASFISALGLLNNNVVPIIGSMVVSPVLSPFYIAISRTLMGKSSMAGGAMGLRGMATISGSWVRAIVHHLLLMFICLAVGFLCGIVNYHYHVFKPESDEMRARSQYEHLIADIIIALVCGFGIAFAILRNDIIVQVGFAIAITILPAIVTGGLYLALAYIKWRHGYITSHVKDNNIDSKYDISIGVEWSEYIRRAWKTVVLTFVNVILVVIASIIVFHIYC